MSVNQTLPHIPGNAVTGPTFASDGTPCIGMTMDNELWLQAFKGAGLMVYKLRRQLLEDDQMQEVLGTKRPIASITGTAFNVAKSHAEGRPIPEEDPMLVAAYVRAAIAEKLAKMSNMKLDYDYQS